MSMESWIEGFEAFKSLIPTASISGGSSNQILVQTATGVTGFVPAPNVTNTYLKWDGSTFVFDAATATPGTRTAVLDLYKWSSTAPTLFPSGTSTYTWATATFTTPATLNGWDTVPPAPVAGQTLWICRQVYADTTTNLTSTVTWAANTAMPVGYASEAGAPAITMNLTNDASSIPADSSGVVPGTFAGTSTTAAVYIGSTDDSANWTFTVTATSGLTYTASNANKTVNVTNMATNLDYGEITFTAAKSGKPNQIIVFSVTKVKSGATGGQTTLYAINTSFGTVSKKSDGSISPTSITFSATQTTGAIGSASYSGRFKIYTQSTIDGAWASVYTSATNEASYTYTVPTSNVVAIKGELYLAGGTVTLLDWEVIPYLVDGANGTRTAYLEVYQWASSTPTLFPVGSSTYTWANGTFTMPATANGWSVLPGTPSAGQVLYGCSVAYSDSSTSATSAVSWTANTAYAVGASGSNGTNGINTALVYIYQRATSAPAVPSATVTYTFATNSVSGLTGGWTTGIPTGTDPVYVTVATASSAGASDTILTNEWASPVLFVQNGTNGTNGINSATVFLFQRTSSSTAPAVPSATVTYTFATGVATGLTNGWTQSMPTTGGAYRWMTQASALASTSTDTIATAEWNTPSVIAQDGVGSANNALVYIYKRSATAPTNPSVTATYTFSTNTITGLNNGWTATIPAGTDPIYVTTAVASSQTDTDTILSSEWAAAVVLSQNGTNGTNGTDGINGVNSSPVFLYQRTSSSTAPSAPASSLVYTFATGLLGGTLGNWSQTMPTSGGAYRWITQASAINSAPQDTILSSEWSAVALLAQDGTDGGSGSTGASTYKIYYAAANQGSAPTTPSATVNGSTPAGWSATPVTLTGVQAQFESDGFQPAGSATTTWSAPYLSYFKVNSLSAITVSTGALNVDGGLTVGTGGTISSGQTAYNTGTGYWLEYNAGTPRLSIGNSSNGIAWNG